mmetsp:Transcript_22786/g.77558  ORF Transcript_22786/g.77558 Transcript_22786/m.77558 type:complete len:201 (-) Transcript_22786:1063-1665(-)
MSCCSFVTSNLSLSASSVFSLRSYSACSQRSLASDTCVSMECIWSRSPRTTCFRSSSSRNNSSRSRFRCVSCSVFVLSCSRYVCNWSYNSATSSCFGTAMAPAPAYVVAPPMLSGIAKPCDLKACSRPLQRPRRSASKCSFLSRSSFNSSAERSWFTFTTFLIILARWPNRKVLMVSCSLKFDGEQVMISEVFALPPRDS